MPKEFKPAQDFDEGEPLPIEMVKVNSSQVAAIGYDPATKTLACVFARGPGHTYQYPNVEPETHAAFLAAESIGTFFGAHIKALPFKKYRAPWRSRRLPDMSAQHTPGRVEVERSGATGSIFLVSGIGAKTIARVTEAEDARRLEACWNAFEGHSTASVEELIAIGGVGSLALVVSEMRDEAAALVADLKEAATTLRRYEGLHRAKGTSESDAKAEVNAALAARFEATIAKAEA